MNAAMEVRFLCGAEAAYACIKTPLRTLDVRLSAGHSPKVSLRESAAELRDQAARLIDRAEFIEQAIELL